jgi:hypothetical protein
MIRAVIRGKKIEPIDPLPQDWTDGREVVVEVAPRSVDGNEDWLAEMDRLSAQLGTQEEWDRMNAELARADAAAKQAVRREMGLE